jgi:hypothetical protein
MLFKKKPDAKALTYDSIYMILLRSHRDRNKIGCQGLGSGRREKSDHNGA